MGFTYNVDLSSNLYRVRFLLQDTTNTTPRPNFLDDGEINWALSTEANIYTAAALCADVIASRSRGVKSKSVGDLSITYSAGEWKEIANRLRARGSTHQVLTAGGITIADRDAIWENTDLLRPDFFSRVHQDPQDLPPARTADLTDEELP